MGARTHAGASPWVRWAVAALTLAVQLYVLYTPETPEVGGLLDLPGVDKLIHVAVFALATCAWLWAAGHWWPVPLMAAHVWLSEWIQAAWIAGRSGDAWDAVAGLAGVAMGWALWWARLRPLR